MSCADLKTLINNTLLHYIVNKETIELDDFIKIINEMNFETIGKKWSSKEVSLEVLAHEMGHAIVEFELTKKWPNISALRFGDTMGHVETDDDFEDEIEEIEESLTAIEEGKIRTYKDVLNDVVICLGGLCGEEVFLHQKSLGSIADLSTIRHLMGRLFDNLVYGTKYCEIYYNGRAPERFNISQFKKVQQVVNKAKHKATRIIKKNRTLCLYLIDEVHKNGDVMSSRELDDRYSKYLSNKEEVIRKYKNKKVKEL